MAKGLEYYSCVFWETRWRDNGSTLILLAKSRAAVARLVKEAYPNALSLDIRLMEEKI